MTPSAAEKTISAKTTASWGRYAPEEREDPAQVRLPDRGVGRPLGRSRRRPAANRRPGICLECLPRAAPGSARAAARQPATGRGSGGERLDGGLEPVGQLACELDGRRRPLDGDRLPDQRGEPREPDPCPAPTPAAFRAAAPAGSGRRWRAPCARHRAARALRGARRLREDADHLARLERGQRRLDRAGVAAVPLRPGSPRRGRASAGAAAPATARPCPGSGSAAGSRRRGRTGRASSRGSRRPRAARWAAGSLAAHLEPVDRPDERRQRTAIELEAQ